MKGLAADVTKRRKRRPRLVGLTRVELVTSRLSAVRSNQLSYWPQRLAFRSRFRRGRRPRTAETEPSVICSVKDDMKTQETCVLRKLCRALVRASTLSAFPIPAGFGNPARQTRIRLLLRKEVIQPHLPVRLPCYDFTPITDSILGSCLLAVGSLTSDISGFHGVTGGVYKARERIQRDLLIRVY